jgi:hypothetical protein
MQQILMLAGRGMTPQMQQMFQNFRPPPMPPELADAFRKMQPQLEAARAAVLKPEVASDMKRYQAAVSACFQSSPLLRPDSMHAPVAGQSKQLLLR